MFGLRLSIVLRILSAIALLYTIVDAFVPIDHVHGDVTVDRVKKKATVGTYILCVDKACTRWFQRQLLSSHPIHN